MHLMIVGIPRSGTTMLSNALSRPPETLVLHEPFLFRDRPSFMTRVQLEELGLQCPERTVDLLAWLAKSVARWGVKEVQSDAISATHDLFDPRIVLFLVRDVSHAALSYHSRVLEARQRAPREGMIARLRRRSRQAAWSWREREHHWRFRKYDFDHRLRAMLLIHSAESVVRLHGKCPASRRLVVRYERFVADPDHRADLARTLEWRLDGDLEVGLRGEGRDSEVARSVDDGRERRRRGERDPARLEYAALVRASCRPYSELFGYPA